MKTKPGTRRLSDVAKHLVPPVDIVSSEWPAVRRTCVQKMGIEFDDWQDGLNRLILAKRADGHLAAMIDGVGMSIPRQVGKTYTVAGLVFGLCVNKPGLLVIWSAHHSRTHAETFLAMQAFAKRSRVAPHIAQVFTGSGTEEIRFRNGSRILFGARERGFGRGIPGVDVLVSDEAQILSDKAMANMIATMNTSQFGLALFMGTPPRPDDMSDGFTQMRNDALEGRLSDGAWIEFGADDDANPNDRKQWAKANPSYPKRTPLQSILRMRRKLTLPDFLREALGIWDKLGEGSLLSLANWGACEDAKSQIADIPFMAIDVPLARSEAAIGVAGRRADGLVHGEVVECRGGLDWVVPWFEAEPSRLQFQVGIDAGSPAASLIEPLAAIGVTVISLDSNDIVLGSAWMYDAIKKHTFRHGPDPDLADEVGATTSRPLGERWAFGRRKSGRNISRFMAVTLAARALDAYGVPIDYDPLASLGAKTKGA